MTRIQEKIDVDVPLHTAYNQWTQFEQFPRFMAGVQQVRQIDDAHLHWVAIVDGQTVEWDSELVQQVPDQIIAWHTTSGAFNSGAARFTALDQERTRIDLEMSTDSPRDGGGAAPDHEHASARARGDLQRFKALIEDQGDASGGWRGEIQDGQVRGSDRSESARQQAAGSTAGSTDGSTDGSQAPPADAGSSAQPRSSASARKATSDAINWWPQMIGMWEEPLTMMRRMSEEMERMVERFIGRPPGYTPAARGSQWTPSVEILRNGEQIMIAADLPGVSKEDVTIEIRDDRLFIEGQRREPGEEHGQESQQGRGRERNEERNEERGQEPNQTSEPASRVSTRHFGRFSRMIALPPGIDADRAEAVMVNGVLQVTLPMPSGPTRGRRLEIQQVQPATPAAESSAQQLHPLQQSQTDQAPDTPLQTAGSQPAPSQPSLH